MLFAKLDAILDIRDRTTRVANIHFECVDSTSVAISKSFEISASCTTC